MKRLIIPMLALAACSQQTQQNAVANDPQSNLPDCQRRGPGGPAQSARPG